jgi:hypothetical protein
MRAKEYVEACAKMGINFNPRLQYVTTEELFDEILARMDEGSHRTMLGAMTYPEKVTPARAAKVKADNLPMERLYSEAGVHVARGYKEFKEVRRYYPCEPR